MIEYEYPPWWMGPLSPWPNSSLIDAGGDYRSPVKAKSRLIQC
jgi:hypothetical protein